MLRPSGIRDEGGETEAGGVDVGTTNEVGADAPLAGAISFVSAVAPVCCGAKSAPRVACGKDEACAPIAAGGAVATAAVALLSVFPFSRPTANGRGSVTMGGTDAVRVIWGGFVSAEKEEARK